MSGIQQLEPDERDLFLASHIVLKACPFCGQNPVPINKFNPETGVYRSLISCAGCMAEVGANYRTKEEAREAAIQKWERRA